MALVNGFDPAAYSIDGARHRGELLRVAEYAATQGSEGIVEAADCKVTQLGTPGAGVAISAGAILMRNRSASVRNQTYVANGRVGSQVDVAATGASARSDLIVVRAKDPQYAPWTALSGADTQYVEPFVVQNVPATTKSFKELNLGYSAYALARVDIPANTTAITNAMIKPLRKLARPRRERNILTYYPDAAYQTPTPPDRAQFTNLNAPVECPEWATQLTVLGTVAQGIYVTAAMTGTMRVEYGYTINSSTFLYTEDAGIHTDSAGYRAAVTAAGSIVVPANYRGLTHNFRLSARGGTGTGKYRADTYSTVIVDYEFVEVPE